MVADGMFQLRGVLVQETLAETDLKGVVTHLAFRLHLRVRRSLSELA